MHNSNKKAWKILIVDDDNEVHLLTRLVLDGFSFDGKGIDFISAYSGREAMALVRENPDIAMVFLDVVMETDDAGLRVVDEIRGELKNDKIQIVLRTGQAGQAPEEEIIANYDINKYVSKVKLTASEMVNLVASSLRAFRHSSEPEYQRNFVSSVCSG